MASINWSPHALKSLDSLDPLIRDRLLLKVSWLGENFNSITLERLHGSLNNAYKLRVGDYRVVYTVRSDDIIVEAVGHRSEIYK